MSPETNPQPDRCACRARGSPATRWRPGAPARTPAGPPQPLAPTSDSEPPGLAAPPTPIPGPASQRSPHCRGPGRGEPQAPDLGCSSPRLEGPPRQPRGAPTATHTPPHTHTLGWRLAPRPLVIRERVGSGTCRGGSARAAWPPWEAPGGAGEAPWELAGGGGRKWPPRSETRPCSQSLASARGLSFARAAPQAQPSPVEASLRVRDAVPPHGAQLPPGGPRRHALYPQT